MHVISQKQLGRPPTCVIKYGRDFVSRVAALIPCARDVPSIPVVYNSHVKWKVRDTGFF